MCAVLITMDIISNSNEHQQKITEGHAEMKDKTSSPLSSSSSSTTQLWNLLPEEVFLYDILFKLPIDSLLRLRYVSRYFHSLITNPSFVRKHLDYSTAQLNLNLLLVTSMCLLPVGVGKMGFLKPVYKHYACNFSSSSGTTSNDIDPSSHLNVVEMCFPFESAGIFGSCNGLLFLHGRKNNRGYIWNPCTKEYKELPPPPSITEEEEHLFEGIETTSDMSMLSSNFGFCGFGYDRTNDDYKVLYQENRVGYHQQLPDDVIRSNNDLVSVTEFKLYTLGTNTWTRISDNPYRSLFFDDEWRRIGVFAHGALYWLMVLRPHEWTQAKIISFNMEKEEFQEIQKPRLEEDEKCNYGRLQVFQGCLCLCEFPKYDDIKKVDIWMLKENNSWTRLFTIMLPHDSIAIRYLQLLRFCKNGEIIMRRDRRNHLIVYDPINQKARNVENLDRKIPYPWVNVVIYIESLVSLKSGTYIV